MFQHIETYAGDPILSLMDAYKVDGREEKVNLSIGLYYNEHGLVQELESVRRVRQLYFEKVSGPSLYLPMDGMEGYCREVQKLIFGESASVLQQGRVATIQTLGGSGALRVGADFLNEWFPESTVWVSNPTWENHVSIFKVAGFQVFTYPYFSKSLGTVDFEALTTCFSGLDRKSIVVLHPCCHNPSGTDLSEAQWDSIIELVKERELIPFFDMAYQGFGRGLDEDPYAIRAMADQNILFLVGNSFSKIFSLYGERVGGLSIVCKCAETAGVIQGQLRATVRSNYSSPPSFGAHLVHAILSNPELNALWRSEVDDMRNRIETMRRKLYDQLLNMGARAEDFSYLLDQKGMFTLTHFDEQQIRALRNNSAIYLVENGRMCVAGLNDNNLTKVAEALICMI